MNLIITRRLRRNCLIGQEFPIQFLSSRSLTLRETSLAKQFSLKRYYLPELSTEQSQEFLSNFDIFWDKIVGCFNLGHAFWRNVVSSKMQEWEGSLAYMALQLYTLSQEADNASGTILFICSSIEESDVCESWGKKHGWLVRRETDSRLRAFFARIVQEASNIARFVYLCTICIYYKINSHDYKPPDGRRKKESILVSSLLYTDSISNGRYTDPFFGNLHKRIDSREQEMTYLCAPLDDFKKATDQIKTCVDTRIILPFSLLKILQLVVLGAKLFVKRVRVPRVDICGCDFSELLAWNARRFTFFNFHAEIYYEAVGALCKHERFERLLLPYEGNVFERACIQAFRENSRGSVIGYSHAVVFPLNMKIRMSPKEMTGRPEPDLLLCTGPENKKNFDSVRKHASVETLAACSLRYIPTTMAALSFDAENKSILVALDGVRGCATVLDWLLENADLFKDQTVIVRPHPNVPIAELKTQCLHQWPENFIASKDDLKTDLSKCFCVIYRQTSVGMQALLNGRMAIHLNVDAPLKCDPLMNLNLNSWQVSSTQELSVAIREIVELPESQKRYNFEKAREYILNYFSVPDEANVSLFSA